MPESGMPATKSTSTFVAPRQRRSAAVAHDLDVDALVARRRIAVVDPQERADLHRPRRGAARLDAVGVSDDLAGPEVAVDVS
jgi:hypothetical protein